MPRVLAKVSCRNWCVGHATLRRRGRSAFVSVLIIEGGGGGHSALSHACVFVFFSLPSTPHLWGLGGLAKVFAPPCVARGASTSPPSFPSSSPVCGGAVATDAPRVGGSPPPLLLLLLPLRPCMHTHILMALFPLARHNSSCLPPRLWAQSSDQSAPRVAAPWLSPSSLPPSR